MKKEIQDLKRFAGEIFSTGFKKYNDIKKPLSKKHHIGERVEENGLFECTTCGDLIAVITGERLPACDVCYAKNIKNKWVKRPENVNFITKNPNIEFERESTFIEKFADTITQVVGSMSFVYVHIIWFGIWVLINMNMTNMKPFDPFPFGLLTMIVSLEAIFLSTFILISQNRITERSEMRSEVDYKVNVNAEKMVTEALGLLHDIKESVEERKNVKKEE